HPGQTGRKIAAVEERAQTARAQRRVDVAGMAGVRARIADEDVVALLAHESSRPQPIVVAPIYTRRRLNQQINRGNVGRLVAATIVDTYRIYCLTTIRRWRIGFASLAHRGRLPETAWRRSEAWRPATAAP